MTERRFPPAWTVESAPLGLPLGLPLWPGLNRVSCFLPVASGFTFGDRATLDRIHEQVPGAPVLQMPVYQERLAEAEAVSQISAGQRSSIARDSAA
jgi:hypothetical protein